MAWINSYLGESKVLSSQTQFSDPVVGRLLAFGNVLEGEKQMRPHKIVAFPRGESGADLGMFELHSALAIPQEAYEQLMEKAWQK